MKKVRYLLELACLIKAEKREHAREVQKAKQMGIDLLQECRDGLLIDPNSAHKPSTQKQQRKSKSKQKKKDSEHSINTENVPNTAPQMKFTSTGPQASKTFNNPFDTTHRPNLSFSPTTAPSQDPFLNNSFNFLGQSLLPHHQSVYYPSFTNQNYLWPAPIPQPPDFTAWMAFWLITTCI